MSEPTWQQVIGSTAKTQLGVEARDRLWRSTLTGGVFRWTDEYYEDGTGTWEVKTSVADWHPARQGGIQTMYSHGGEKYVEVTE